jgi:hypothetical protein
VDEQGRDKLPPASPIDTAGDTAWIYEFYRIADSLDLAGFLALHTADVRLTFANYPTSTGQQALGALIGGLWKRIQAMSHSLSGVWSMHDGKVGVAEGACMYTRSDNSLYTAKTCTVLRRQGNKIAEVRIHVDLSGL